MHQHPLLSIRRCIVGDGSFLGLPGVCTTACMFFSCSCWMRSDLALLSFSKQRNLCTYWLFRNFNSMFSWSNFVMWAFSSGRREEGVIRAASRVDSQGQRPCEGLRPPTSDDPLIVLLQPEKLLVQIIVLPDHPSVLQSERLHKSLHVPALLFRFPHGEFGIAQTLGCVDQVTEI